MVLNYNLFVKEDKWIFAPAASRGLDEVSWSWRCFECSIWWTVIALAFEWKTSHSRCHLWLWKQSLAVMWIRRSHFATRNLTNESHGGRIMAAKWNVKKKTGSETRTCEAVLPPRTCDGLRIRGNSSNCPAATGIESEKNQMILICSTRRRRRAHYSAPTPDTLLPVLRLAH